MLQKDNYVQCENGQTQKQNEHCNKLSGKWSEFKIVAGGMQRKGEDQEILTSAEFDDWLVIKKKDKRVINNACWTSDSFLWPF